MAGLYDDKGINHPEPQTNAPRGGTGIKGISDGLAAVAVVARRPGGDAGLRPPAGRGPGRGNAPGSQPGAARGGGGGGGFGPGPHRGGRAIPLPTPWRHCVRLPLMPRRALRPAAAGAAAARRFSTDLSVPFRAGDALGPGVGNKAIALKLCKNVTLSNFSVLRGGHFALLATGVDNLTLDNLKIDTNRDGFDIDGCRNVRLSNCASIPLRTMASCSRVPGAWASPGLREYHHHQ